MELFEVSVGLHPYPITFLITYIPSEIYEKKKANEVVIAGLFASLFSLLIIFVSKNLKATTWSTVNNTTFKEVFEATSLALFASLLAYLFAQFVDIRVYHFWKKLTKGKYLWLLNNFSTFLWQCIDTLTVLVLLCSLDRILWDIFFRITSKWCAL